MTEHAETSSSIRLSHVLIRLGLNGGLRVFLTYPLAAYGATILSFLGGIHWGLAMGSQSSEDRRSISARLTVSVLPSIAGWSALLVSVRAGLFTLAAAIAAMLLIDLRATWAGYFPCWYPKLRIPLTGVVVAALLSGAIV